jgi:hypothetical protein
MAQESKWFRLRARSVSWPSGRSSPAITLPAQECQNHGVEHTDEIPVEYESETGVLKLYLEGEE